MEKKKIKKIKIQIDIKNEINIKIKFNLIVYLN